MTYTNLGEKVRAWRLGSSIEIKQFAEKVGTSRQNIENLEAGSIGIPRYVAKLAKSMGTSVDDLIDLRRPIPPLHNAASSPKESPIDVGRQTGYNSTHITSEIRTVPLFSTPPNSVGLAVAEQPAPYGVGITTGKVGENGYALRVRGSSMLNPHGSPSFPEGCLIFVNPDLKAEPGNFMVTQLPGDGGFTFKRLTADGGNLYLESLNPKFDLIPLPHDAPDLGVVVSMGMDVL